MIRVPFARPDITEAEIEACVSSLRSGWITTGPRTAEFEREFAAFVHGTHAVGLNSATAGLHLALEALGIGPGDEVVVPTYTFTASAEVVRYLGADPVLVDVDADTLNMQPEALRAAIGKRTKAVIPVHIAGLACDMAGILGAAREAGIAVVEDAAHALPSTSGGTMVGAFPSDATVYSFYATKPIATGEGGMLVTGRADIADRVRLMRLHGLDRRATSVPEGELAWRYDVAEAGYKYNPTDFASAIGLAQLRRLPEMTRRRTAIAARYDEAFAGLPVRRPAHAPAGDVHSWHLYMLRITDESPVARDAFIQAMYRLGIECSVHYIPLHRHSFWRDRYALRPDSFPHADDAGQRTVSLPISSAMPDSAVEAVIGAVRQVLRA